MSLVLDGSTTLAWIYQDEIGDAARRILALVTGSGAWVPSTWRLEVANGLQMGCGRIYDTYRNAALSDLALLDISRSIDPDTDRYAWTSTLHLADRFGLTLYDAAYLELAQRRSLPLASLDMALCDAAKGLGVDLVPNPE